MLEKLFEVSKRVPERVALISGDKRITYGELLNKSAALALFLEEKLGDRRDPVVVYGHKNPLMLVCFLACVRTGRAYCPTDISMPLERTWDIVDSVGTEIILAPEENCDLGDNLGKYTVITLEEIEKAVSEESRYYIERETLDESLSVKEDDIYYIIFTSGSTGKPKGVEISHGALSRFTDWSSTLAFDAEDKDGAVFLNQAPFSFDLSVMDLYTSLACGGTEFCLSKDTRSDMETMLEALEKSGINYWVSTPSFADMCLSDHSFKSSLLPSLRAFLFCGEKLTKDTAGKLMERFPEAKVMNTYGPTESTVAVTEVLIEEKMLKDEKELPIGRVKPGTEIRIAPDTKEILILGDTLSEGYFRNPEKTAEAFFITEDGKRAYHTGDEGFFDGDMLYYRGRIDSQIKLHGYRIELGDIESNLIEIDGIRAAAVLPKRRDGSIKFLVAFVVMEGKEEGERHFEEAKAIKEELKKKLPEYMVPKKIVFKNSLPMTHNGKTDRKKLENTL